MVPVGDGRRKLAGGSAETAPIISFLNVETASAVCSTTRPHKNLRDRAEPLSSPILTEMLYRFLHAIDWKQLPPAHTCKVPQSGWRS